MIVDNAIGAPQKGDDTRKNEIQDIQKLIEQGDPRLFLLAAEFEEFVPIIPDLVAQTEEEIHSQRFRTIRRQAQ